MDQTVKESTHQPSLRDVRRWLTALVVAVVVLAFGYRLGKVDVLITLEGDYDISDLTIDGRRFTRNDLGFVPLDPGRHTIRWRHKGVDYAYQIEVAHGDAYMGIGSKDPKVFAHGGGVWVIGKSESPSPTEAIAEN